MCPFVRLKKLILTLKIYLSCWKENRDHVVDPFANKIEFWWPNIIIIFNSHGETYK